MPAVEREVADVGDAQRERLREAAAAEEQVGPDEPVVAQLVGLADRLRAQPELVRVRRRRARRDDRGERDARPRETSRATVSRRSGRR